MGSLMDELRGYGNIRSKSGFNFVTINPPADDTELLARLNVSPDQCVICDLYWAYEGRLLFVSISCLGPNNPLVSYHQNQSAEHKDNFYVSTNVCPITLGSIEKALIYISKWILDHEDIFTSILEKNYIITREDIFRADKS